MGSPFFTFDARVHPICQIGMGSTRQAEPTSWLDVSCYVHEAELFRGRERFNERFEPGTASVTFSNANGWADLGGTYAQVAAAELRPGRQIRIGVRGPWHAGQSPFIRWLYRGFIDQATPHYDPTVHDVVTVNCIDALGEAGSSPAPTDDFQGVNETVAHRINRVLDAVGWWSTKRKIGATPTRVQGTELGSAAIDHMGQAADSAGGVVFGDLDGDVVFKDIDWMLYDPGDPPDDTVGPGPPGTPPDDEPPYVDPTPGPVHDPDDPPAEHPPKVCVCADGTEGTLVEKGDNYRIYVRNGHLYYETSGHTWDLGPYSGGCTCVEPPGGDGGGGGGGGTPPVRTDDPDEDGNYDPSPFPPVELPPQFAVEFLGYSDAGLSDPAMAAVTVPGIAPGHDCTLVVLINALGTATNAAGLAPTIEGGGLDYDHRHDADQAGEGASSFIAVAPVGRDDPGTFDVVVTWADGMTSRTHIVTVWKCTAAINNYLERYDAGVILYATTDSNPPDEAEPGDGFQLVELATDHAPPDVDEFTRTVDITVAQSLAEEGTPPFGARFDTTETWTTPAFADELPSPGARTGGTAIFFDDFERAAGPLGDSWMQAPTGPGGTATYGLEIAAGNAVDPTQDATGPGRYSFYAVEVPDDHYIEISLTSMGGASNVVGAVARFDPVTFTGLELGFVTQATSPVGAEGNLQRITWTDGASVAVTLDHVPNPSTLRIEATAAGHFRLLADGELIDEFDDPTLTGTYLGIHVNWVLAAGGTSVASPEIASATIGTLGFCDEFDRPDGPIGPDWVVSLAPGWADNVHPLVIDTGAAVGSVLNESGGAYDANAMHLVAAQGFEQAIEIEVETGDGGYCYVFAQANDTTPTCQFVDFQFGSTIVSATLFRFDADGNGTFLAEADAPITGSTTVLRLESDSPTGEQRVFIDGTLIITFDDPIGAYVGPFVGIGTERQSDQPVTRILSACVGEEGAGGGITRKCSWVAGWRAGVHSHTVAFDDVNYGPSNIQSAQACLVLESAEPELGWRILGHDVRAATTGVTAAGSLTFDNPPRPGALVAVFVGVTASTPVMSSVTVTGADFTPAIAQPKAGASWGQGAVYTAVAPLDLDLSSWAVVVNYPAVESISVIVYEVTEQDDEGYVGATASGVLGDGTAGSVDGPSSITLSAAGDAAAVVLASIHVAADPGIGSGASTVDGDEWTEELQSSSIQRAYYQTMSRAPGQPESTSIDVHWADVQTGTAPTYSAVQLALEVHPYDALPPLTGAGSGVALGGVTDPFNGTITSAGAYDPVTGDPIWTFP